MIVTTSDRAEKVIDRIKHSKEWNYEVTSVVIMDKDMKGSTISKVPVIAGADDMISEATKNIVDRVFISLPLAARLFFRALYGGCRVDFDRSGRRFD